MDDNTPFFYYSGGDQASATVGAAPSLFSAGFLTADTPTWVSGTADWTVCSKCPVLSQVLAAQLSAASASGGTRKRAREAESAAPTEPGATTGEEEEQEEEGAEGEEEEEDEQDEQEGTAAAAAAAAATAASGTAQPKRKRAARKSRRPAKGPNCWVYITGLPPDASAEELLAHFKRAGIIRLDYGTGQAKLKLYLDPATGQAKGDASLCYLQAPSVELAVALLDGAPLRPTPLQPPEACWPLTVQPAVFEAAPAEGGGEARHSARGGEGGAGGGAAAAAATTALAPAASASSAAIRAAGQKALLSWAEGDEGFVQGALPGGSSSSGGAGEPLKIVQFENLYDAQEAAAGGAAFLAELREDFVPEVERLGAIQKVTFFPQQPGGLAVVKFRSIASATSCLNLFNGRLFGGRRVVCKFWEGQDWRGGEEEEGGEEAAEAAEARRIEQFGQWLEGHS